MMTTRRKTSPLWKIGIGLFVACLNGVSNAGEVSSTTLPPELSLFVSDFVASAATGTPLSEDIGQRSGLLPYSPTRWLHQEFNALNQILYDQFGLKFNASYTFVINHASAVLEAKPGDGSTFKYDLSLTWDLIDRDGPWNGRFVGILEQRVRTGPTTATGLADSVGTVMGGIKSFDEVPFYVAKAYWEQGNVDSGFHYLIGRYDPTDTIDGSKYLSSKDTFFGTGLIVSRAIDLPSNGFGAIATLYPTPEFYIEGTISDTNGDKETWGDLGAGEYFTSGAIGFQPNYGQAFEGRYQFLFWHSDGSVQNEKDPGWGYAIHMEQDLTAEKDIIGMLRYSRSYDSSAKNIQQASAYLIFNNLTQLEGDQLGIAVGWADPRGENVRDEYIAEAYYKFPITEDLIMTLDAQVIFDPYNNFEDDTVGLFGIRLREKF